MRNAAGDKDHYLANVIIQGARDDQAILVFRAINRLTRYGSMNRGSVMVACAQILAHCITQAEPEIAPEVREGIIGLIDSYAMRLAVEKPNA